MTNERLPLTIKCFVDQQTTRPVTEVWDNDPEDQFSPYGTYYYRAIACMLLSERVQAKMDGHPNMTDVNRIGKEANFNQYLFDRVAKFLIGIEALKPDRAQRCYVEGPNIEAFWKHDTDRLKTGANRAIARLFEGELGLQPWSRRPAHHAHLIELLILFFASFKGRAILEPSFGQVFLDFTQLPKGELIQLAQDLGQKKSAGDLENLRKSLDAKGQKALLAALYTAEWAYYTESDATGWLFASPIGLGMLGLETPPAAPRSRTSSKRCRTSAYSRERGWGATSSCRFSVTASSRRSTKCSSSSSTSGGCLNHRRRLCWLRSSGKRSVMQGRCRPRRPACSRPRPARAARSASAFVARWSGRRLRRWPRRSEVIRS